MSYLANKCSSTKKASKLPAPDDTASPPHEGNASVVEVPAELLGGLPQQHEALRVRHDLARVQRLQRTPLRSDVFNGLITSSMTVFQ